MLAIVAYVPASASIKVSDNPIYSYQNAPNENLSARTRNSKTYITGPGTYALELTIGSQHYLDEYGDWQDIDTSFIPAASPWSWQTTGQNSYGVRVKEDITAGQVIEFSKAGEYVTLQPMALEWTNDISQIQQISMPANNGIIVSDNESPGKITWRNSYGAGIDLTWSVGNDRLKKELAIAGLNDLPPPEPYIVAGGNPVLRYNFIFDPSAGVDVWIDGELWDKQSFQQTYNYIEFMKGTEILWGFAPLVYSDSSGDIETESGQSIATVEKRGNSLYIYITVPYEWLQAAAYPVYIDPTIEVQPGQQGDDVVRILGSDSFSIGNQSQYAGASGGNQQYGGGMRFQTITIPNSALIDTATLIFTGRNAHSGANALTRISADDVDDAAVFSTKGDYDTRYAARTTARVDWDNIPAWSVDEKGADTTSPDIKTIVQELVDRPGWATGQDMVFFWEDYDDRSPHVAENYRFGYSWDHVPAKSPILHVEYTIADPPSVTTGISSGINGDSAMLTGNVSDPGSGNLTRAGFEWGTIPGVFTDNVTVARTITGNFTLDAAGLEPDTPYFWRAIALNDISIQYGVGETKGFRTENPFNIIEVSAVLNQTKAAGAGKPTIVFIGIQSGLSLPIWNSGGNSDEELNFQIHIPHQWNRTSDLEVHFDVAISQNETEKNFKFQIDHSHFSSGVDLVPSTFVTWTLETMTGTATQYQSYEIKFEVPFDHIVGDNISFEDVFQYRLRRIAASANDTGEIIVFHSGVHFIRGDLDEFLTEIPETDIPETDLSGLITEAQMAELALILTIGVTFIPLILFSVLAFWRRQTLLFIITAAIAVFTGLAWFDQTGSSTGMAVGLAIVFYGLVCLGLAYNNVFRRENAD